MADEQNEATKGSESDTNALLCGCSGNPVKGALCGYVTVGGKFCKAPANYECEHKKEDVKEIPMFEGTREALGNLCDLQSE